MSGKKLCSGCNVSGNQEHRCIGIEDCECKYLACRITRGELSQIKWLNPGTRFRFKNRKTINVIIRDTGLVMLYENPKGIFETDYYNEYVEVVDI